MKRLFLVAAGAMSASFLFIPPASAHVAEPAPHPAAPRSGSPPRVLRVQAPAPVRVTVAPGDTLSAIGTRTHRPWPALASYNRISDPDLILPGQILVIPPANYQPPPTWTDTPSSTGTAPPTVVTQAPAVQVSAPAPAPSGGGGGGIWACIAAHESGGNPATNTGNGYYGAFQDTLGSWQSAGGGPGLPSDYSYATQLAVNQRIQAQQGWGAWPVSSGACGA